MIVPVLLGSLGKLSYLAGGGRGADESQH